MRLLHLLLVLFVLFIVVKSQSDNYILYNYYQYSDRECSGEVVFGKYVVNGYCEDNVSKVCNSQENSLTINTWSGPGCTGYLVSKVETRLKGCKSSESLSMDCVDQFDIPSDSFVSIEATSCDWKSDLYQVSFEKIKTCVDINQNPVYLTCDPNILSGYVYSPNSNCTGSPVQTISTPIPGCHTNSIGNSTTTYICNV